MKRLFLILLFSAVFSLRAQEPPTVKPVENTNEEVFEMLQLLGAKGYRFDLSAFNSGEYKFSPFTEEYVAGKKQKGGGSWFGATLNWRPLLPDDAFDTPEERGKWLAGKTLSADGQKYLNFENMGLFIVPQNDSVSRAGFRFYGSNAGTFPLKLKPLENSSPVQYLYNCRPFRIYPTAEKKQRIPLLLYGSFWWDEKFKVHRFCGDNEIEPDLSSEILKSIPHYYVIGIEVQKTE